MKSKTCFLHPANLFVPLLLIAFSPVVRGQANVLSVGEILPLHLKRGETVEQKLTLQLRPGFHVNSNKPNDEFLIPLRLTWSTSSAVEAAPVQYPAPKTEKSDFSEKPLSVFDGDFRIVTLFRASPSATPGAGVLNGKLRYQACNNRECLQPKTIDLKLPYDIE